MIITVFGFASVSESLLIYYLVALGKSSGTSV